MTRVLSAQRSLKASPRAASVLRLREQLLDAQYELHTQGRVGLVVLVTGLPLAGRTEAVSKICHWLNPKLLSTHARPAVTVLAAAIGPRWFEAVPPVGEISVVYDGWYEAMRSKHFTHQPPSVADQVCIGEFEQTLVANRVQLLKLHFTISALDQKKRRQAFAKDPLRAWRVGGQEPILACDYRLHRRRVRQLLAATDKPKARWLIIDGSDSHAALLHAGRAILSALRRALKVGPLKAMTKPFAVTRRYNFPSVASQPQQSALATGSLRALQAELALQLRRDEFANRSLIAVFEGMDAAGKSQSINHLTAALDPRQYSVIPVGVPTANDQRYPYLYRFWRSLSMAAPVALYDRSWYGRVLVEKVEGLCAAPDVRRAYAEIRQLEAALVQSGAIVVKFWLSVGYNEQRRRFVERAANPLKRFKVDPRDGIARRHWWDYQAAAKRVFEQTHCVHAPWVIIPADDKRYARHAVLDAVCTQLRLNLGPVPVGDLRTLSGLMTDDKGDP